MKNFLFIIFLIPFSYANYLYAFEGNLTNLKIVDVDALVYNQGKIKGCEIKEEDVLNETKYLVNNSKLEVGNVDITLQVRITTIGMDNGSCFGHFAISLYDVDSNYPSYYRNDESFAVIIYYNTQLPYASSSNSFRSLTFEIINENMKEFINKWYEKN